MAFGSMAPQPHDNAMAGMMLLKQIMDMQNRGQGGGGQQPGMLSGLLDKNAPPFMAPAAGGGSVPRFMQTGMLGKTFPSMFGAPPATAPLNLAPPLPMPAGPTPGAFTGLW